jgi:hypothetical protein
MSKRKKQGNPLLKLNKINEKYYAEDSNPNFSQFGKDYHFIDEKGRLYKIATHNNQIFDNERFKYYTEEERRRKGEKSLKCYKSGDGYIKFFVKLPEKDIPWFFDKDLNKEMILRSKDDKEDGFHLIKVKQAFKKNVKRRTGTVFIQGINEIECNEILNK